MTKDTPLEAKVHLINRNDAHDDESIEKIINLESVFLKKNHAEEDIVEIFYHSLKGWQNLC